jgi:hypothetical protein
MRCFVDEEVQRVIRNCALSVTARKTFRGYLQQDGNGSRGDESAAIASSSEKRDGIVIVDIYEL